MSFKVFLNSGAVIVIKADDFYLDGTWDKDNPWIFFESANEDIVAAVRQSEVIAIVEEATNEKCEIPFQLF